MNICSKTFILLGFFSGLVGSCFGMGQAYSFSKPKSTRSWRGNHVWEHIEVAAPEESVPAGSADYVYTLKEDGETTDCYIEKLLIEDAHRNKGVGTELFHRVLKRLADQGCKEVRWQAYPFKGNLTQEQLNAFYQKRNGICVGPSGPFGGTDFVYHCPERKQTWLDTVDLPGITYSQMDLFGSF